MLLLCCLRLLLLPRPPVHRELQPYDEPTCRAVAYDFSGQYVAVGGSDLRVYSPKQVSQAPTDPPKFLPRLDRVCHNTTAVPVAWLPPAAVLALGFVRLAGAGSLAEG